MSPLFNVQQKRCKGFRQLALKHLEDEQTFGALRELHFERPSFYVAEVRLIDLSPISALPHLESLVLDIFTFIDDNDVARIIAACERLKHLSLRVPRSSHHAMVTGASLGKLHQCLPLLEALLLQNVRAEDGTVESFAALQHLRSLSLEDVNISPSALRPLFHNARFAKCSLRQCFNLSRRLLSSRVEEMIAIVRQDDTAARRVVSVAQESAFDPPKFVNVPRNMTLKLTKMRY